MSSNPSASATDNNEDTSLPTTKSDKEEEEQTQASTATTVSKDDLIELVKAIKFAKPEASQKQVHREITQELVAKHGDSYAFLKDISLNDVKKVWKKALQQQPPRTDTPATTNNNNNNNNNNNSNADLLAKLQLQDQPPQVFTIGNNNSVQFLAQQYASQVIAQQMAQQAAEKEIEQANLEALHRDFVHVFLDVPADKTGQRPYQALINFQSKSVTTNQESGGNTTNKKKKQSIKKKTQVDTNHQDGAGGGGPLIVKIQRAAPQNEMDTVQHPMLLYNQSRTYKTFIHPDEDDEHHAFQRIQDRMIQESIEGVLGTQGGRKAYFYANVTPNPQKGQSSILSIDITKLAPPQEW